MTSIRSYGSSPSALLLAGLLAAVVVTSCSDSSADPNGGNAVGSVEGEVIGPTGDGVSGATLTLSTSGASARTTNSGSDGAFSFSQVSVGQWTVAIDPPSGWVLASGEPQQRGVTVTAGGTSQVSFQLDPVQGEGSLAGVVLHDGWGVGEVELELRGPEDVVVTITSSGDGQFDSGSLADGTWELEITPPDWFELAPGEAAVQTLTISGTRLEREISLSPVTAQETFEIEALGSMEFSPSSATVAPGTRVRWINETSLDHTVTPEGHSAWEEGTLTNAGDVFEVVLNNPGEYPYLCVPHQAGGMTGQVTVQP